MQQSLPLSKAILEGNKQIQGLLVNFLPVIPCLIMSVVFGSTFQDNSDTFTIVMMGLLTIINLGFAIFLAIKSLRLILHKVELYENSIRVKGFKEMLVNWDDIAETHWYYTETYASRGIRLTHQGVKLKTQDGSTLLINSVFKNFNEIIQIIEQKTSHRIANNIIQNIKNGNEVKFGETRLNKTQLSKKVLLKTHKVDVEQTKSIQIVTDQATGGDAFEIVTQNYEAITIPFLNQPNSFALLKVAEHYAHQNLRM